MTFRPKLIRWTFADGPMAGTHFEHSFDDDGSVTWTILDGPYKGASKREKSCSVVSVNEKTAAISYLAASGHTLTVVLSLADGRAVGFASNEKEWQVTSGTFEVVA
ncbi:MAG TPA: hypothetical protein VF980_20205 [Thermoanaerobaculia bacterium]